MALISTAVSINRSRMHRRDLFSSYSTTNDANRWKLVLFRFAAISIIVCVVMFVCGCLSRQSPGSTRRNCRLVVTAQNEVVVIATDNDTIRALPNDERIQSALPAHIPIKSPTWLIVDKTHGANYFADVAQVYDGHEIVVYSLSQPNLPKRLWSWRVPGQSLVLCVAVANDGERFAVGIKDGVMEGAWIVNSDGTSEVLATTNILMPLSLVWFTLDGNAFVSVNYEAGPIEMFSAEAPHAGAPIANTSRWGHMIGNVANKYLVHAGIEFRDGSTGVAVLQVEQVSKSDSSRMAELVLGDWSPQQTVGIADQNEITLVCRCLDNDRQSSVFIGVADLVGDELLNNEFKRWEWYQWEPGLDVHDVALADRRGYALATVDDELGVFSCDTSRVALSQNPRLKAYNPAKVR